MRILLVDDDPQQARSLAQLISLSADNLQVETATGGAAGIERLKHEKIDLVLTDLQMPKPSGLDLVEWIMVHQPQITVFAMTAYPDDAALQQLEEFGTVECFTKPLHVPTVTKRLTEAASVGLRGHLRNVSLPSLLQLVELERNTCTFVLESGKHKGHLYLRQGQLVDAHCEQLRGAAAAIEQLSWPAPQVTIISTCASKENTITEPAAFLIMEAMRLQDEREHTQSLIEANDTSSSEKKHSTRPPASTSQALSGQPVPKMRRSLSQFPAPPPSRASAIAVIDQHGGKVLFSSGHFKYLHELAPMLAEMFEAERKLAVELGEEGAVEELVLAAHGYWAVCRPLHTPIHSLAVSIFDPKEATVAMERFELNGLALALQDWTQQVDTAQNKH